MSARTWIAGEEHDLSDAEWSERAAAMLGCGFRAFAPVGGLEFARAQADEVAAALGARLDPVAWAALRDGHVAASSGTGVVIEGGWEFGFRGSLGSPLTRITPLPGPEEASRRARAAVLPWLLSSQSPTAGLAMLSGLENAVAERWLATTGAEVGIWLNERGEVATSSAGPVLLRLDSGWVTPEASSGVVTNYALTRAVHDLGAEQVAVGEAMLPEARDLRAIDGRGATKQLSLD